MQKVDHTAQWRQYGQITKLNLYYSWNFGCLQGIKVSCKCYLSPGWTP
jgi:hypothetical protein